MHSLRLRRRETVRSRIPRRYRPRFGGVCRTLSPSTTNEQASQIVFRSCLNFIATLMIETVENQINATGPDDPMTPDVCFWLESLYAFSDFIEGNCWS